MSSNTVLHADGSSVADARRNTVNRKTDPYRWRCPNGHTSWSETNSHVWCTSCARSPNDADPEHYELLDLKTGELVDFASVTVVE